MNADNSTLPGSSISKLSSIALYRRLLAYLKPLWLMFLVSIVGFAIYAACSAWFADLIRQLIDTIDSGGSLQPEERLKIPLTLLILIICRGIGGFLGSYFMAYVANNVVHRIRCQLVDQFLLLPNAFYDNNTTGHLMSRVTFNVNQVYLAVSDALTVVFREGLTVVALVIVMFILNWKLTLIFIAVMPLISLVVLFASKKFRKHSSQIQVSMGDVTHILSETIKGLKEIRSFGAEKQVQEHFRQTSEHNLKQNLKMASTLAISTPVIQVLVGSALALLLWLAMEPVALNAISTGELVGFITAAGMLLKPVRQLSRINASIQQGLAAGQSVFELIDEEIETDGGDIEIDRIKGKVEYRNVSFTYGRNTKAVLENISFICEPGKTIAIVGKSGSGKTTLVNLLPRFYAVDSGEILLDDIPQNDYSLKTLRQQIALVGQQIVLFNTSIRENIAYGSLVESSDEEILQALNNANAMEFIEQLPEGINTKIGDDGLLLSGGQRQRLAIARALLKNAPILIFDEATSALDTVSERFIQSALNKLMQGRTTFVIAHRLSTIENADYILVMDQGRIVEAGTHQELLAQGQHYSTLHQLQFTDE